MPRSTEQGKETVSFGPFGLVATERLLTRDGAPVKLSGRALDILIALLASPNEPIGKKDLLARVWPDVVVEEGSLRFHIVALRKALGDGRDGARYIATLPGRGYCFVAPISRSLDREPEAPMPGAGFPHANLPILLARMVGRDDDVARLSTHLTARRFVTIAGAGGVGKTTVAIAVGHRLMAEFAGAVLFVDLGMIGDPALVVTAVASMLGLSVQSADATPSLIAYLRERRILLILDTCEHLIEAVAGLASRIFAAAPRVHILATSREVLQVEDEHVYRLNPLACPPEHAPPGASKAQNFPATQLFVERAAASGARLACDEEEFAVVADICRKLDGVALAIELAARRVESYGLRETAALLDQRLTRLWPGSRTAPPRHRTLQATLDWSYGLLSEVERIVLRRLAVFVGHFTLDAALAVAPCAAVHHGQVLGAIDGLVAKSVVATRPIGAMMRYRLLDTTRAYVLDINSDGDDAELADLAVRHATYYRQWLEQNGAEWTTLRTGAERAPHFAGLNNVRAALEWCFGASGDARVGVALAAAAAPVFLVMSLLPECHRWSERAIGALDDATRGGIEEMHLQAGIGISSMHMHGQGEAARRALTRSLEIAEARDEILHQVGLLGMLHMFHFRAGEFMAALDCATRRRGISTTVDDPAALALSHSILGRSLHLMGDIAGARAELEASLHDWSRSSRAGSIYLAHDRRYRASAGLARTLWLQGYPDQAVETARRAIEGARGMDQPESLVVVAAWAASVFFWTGDPRTTEELVDLSIAQAEAHALGPLLAVGRCRKAELAIHHGDAAEGVRRLRAAMKQVHEVRYELITTEFDLSLAQGLAASGEHDNGLAHLDATMRRVEANGDISYMPELLRARGNLLLATPRPDAIDAENCFKQSLELSRRHGSRGWELRAAADLAALWAGRGRSAKARALLQPVFAQFEEGLETADLKAAERVLKSLDG